MKNIQIKKQLPNTYISSFCMELALILNAGIDINDGIMILYEDDTDKHSKEILKSIYEKLKDNIPLHSALKQEGIFPDYMTDMIDIGSQTGKLEQVLRGLADYYDNQENITSHIRSAVIYPTVLLMLMLVVIFLLITKVLPLFNNVFAQFGSELSPFASALLSLGSAIQNYIVIIVIIFLALIVTAALIYINEKLRTLFINKIINKIFAKRRVALTLSSARFADALSICLSSGMDIDKSLQMALKTNTNPSLAEKINTCASLIEQGVPSSEAFIKSRIFSGIYGRMLAVGYKTGSADEIMREIAKRLSSRASEEISATISRVEPTLVIILSVIVGAILLSVMIPLMSIMSVIG